MSHISRRGLLAGGAAVGTFAATASLAQPDQIAADIDLQGKNILVTGCSSGFGRLMAEDFARKGATVFATMRNMPRPEAEELETLAETEGLDLHVIEIDVMSDEQVSSGVAKAEEIAGGAIDVLINNAGIGYAGPIELQDMQATQLIFDTNVYGPHRMSRAALPAMRRAKGGLIFNISSQLGRVIVPSAGHYSPTKFALEAMSEAMAYELVPHGVEVCVIEPGGYPTKVWVNRNRLANELKERLNFDERAAYPQLVARMGEEDGTRRTADPMDVPNAIAEIIAMPPGTRPLRKAVHPGNKPQVPINELTAKVQVDWLGQSGFGPWIKDVHNV
ncbi:SDR family oxidoreductase [Altererythrobacter ishigakiensis]|uniref:Short-subunit dehydrogenase n=1 Tax=Altererythrobacter ishigakiensis TaxID=476157 RepID=A0A562UWI6_9SPHN|nr:SDR family oxidoreductase [Altererythrobacter ishigakiensis]MDX1703538.1 SDR family oxidoreductase [Altererythrobacter ishigakiensis]TWJ09992.1 short-subunit dehydrogenase [Altererythrobacter ishigakiensis]